MFSIENPLYSHNRGSSDNKEITNNKSQISDNFQDPIPQTFIPHTEIQRHGEYNVRKRGHPIQRNPLSNQGNVDNHFGQVPP
jgi:hypothetical protein|tara:strand:+ start:104 stop:349 length:246 start_codon:yes stop_codon:yes gene_type:complete